VLLRGILVRLPCQGFWNRRTVESVAGKPIKLLRCANTRSDPPMNGSFQGAAFYPRTKSHSLPTPLLSLILVVFPWFLGMVLLSHVPFSVSSRYSLALSAPGSSLQKERQTLLFVSIIKINVPINMVPPTTTNPAQDMKWWSWKASAFGERSRLFFSVSKSIPQICGIHVKICAKLCWLSRNVGFSLQSLSFVLY